MVVAMTEKKNGVGSGIRVDVIRRTAEIQIAKTARLTHAYLIYNSRFPPRDGWRSYTPKCVFM